MTLYDWALAFLVWLAFGRFVPTPIIILLSLLSVRFEDMVRISAMSSIEGREGYAKALGRHLRHRQVLRWYGNLVWRLYAMQSPLPRQVFQAFYWPFFLPVSVVAGNKAVMRILWHTRGKPMENGKPYYGPPRD